MLTPGVNVLKLFSSLMTACKKASGFVIGQPLQPSLMFMRN
jgi:hypothetical protein